jgi:uncharacterized protein
MECCNVWVLCGAALLAACVGVLTGIFGIGGGFLTTPALIFLLGIPGPIAVGTDVAMIFATSSFGMFKRRGTNTIDTKLAMTMSVGSGVGVLVGLVMLEILKGMQPLVVMGKEHIAVQYLLLIFFCVLLAGMTIFMAYDCKRSASDVGKTVGYLDRLRMPPYVHFSTLNGQAISLIPVIIIGASIGVLTGLLGIGGGVIMVPCLIYLIGQDGRHAVGTSLMIVWLTTLIGSIGNIKEGNVNVALLAAMLIGGIIGTHYGTMIGLKLDHNRICRYFAYVVGVAAVLVIYKLCTVTFF